MAFSFILKNLKTHKQRRIEISESGDYIFGRAKDCDVRVADKKVSGKHFILNIENNRVTVKDLESRNGLVIDGIQVKWSRFFVNSTLEFGVYTLVFDKKALSARELAINTNTNKDSEKSDITLIALDSPMIIEKENLSMQRKSKNDYDGKDISLIKSVRKSKIDNRD